MLTLLHYPVENMSSKYLLIVYINYKRGHSKRFVLDSNDNLMQLVQTALFPHRPRDQ